MEVNFIRKPNKKDEALVNEAIRAREVLVIADDGEQLGVKQTKEALNLAYSRNLDLVCVAPNAKPPVCRLMDYSKYRYEQQRKAREARKNQKTVELKEIRLSPTIEKHDLEFKLKNCRKFLDKGNKVKISIRFRGRMIAHKKLGFDVVNNFAEELSEIADVEKKPKMDGRSLFMIIAPKKDNKK